MPAWRNGSLARVTSVMILRVLCRIGRIVVQRGRQLEFAFHARLELRASGRIAAIDVQTASAA